MPILQVSGRRIGTVSVDFLHTQPHRFSKGSVRILQEQHELDSEHCIFSKRNDEPHSYHLRLLDAGQERLEQEYWEQEQLEQERLGEGHPKCNPPPWGE